ncbi:hypothetical protein HOP51_02140 [Halomonas sp. MCCC 1A11036]|uniref:Glycosyltransferase family 92 protein n=1 Tax=Billgrantia zhangzhouensis TaxID=2733481 RepID=A0ABS9AAJ7_9GAMM|nr:glycosyltransferase family 2 protein [Halomonas zhangzhouensis]MCE8018922.1 hypothetical protein [Halomonas zhangzhouensis]
MFKWPDQKKDVLGFLSAGKKTDFIVALKTKNESELLEDWIKHHGDIFGIENLVIFDNDSDDIKVLDIYEKYKSKVRCIVKYDNSQGSHNAIHHPQKFPELYEMLSQKCKYFALFDTDEFFVGVKDDKYFSGKQLYRLLIEEAKKNKYNKIIFCFWLNSLPGCDGIYDVGNNYMKLVNGAKNGKHFVPSSFLLDFPRGHNSCVPREAVSDSISTSFWLLHKQAASFKRRIRVNYNKIKARNAFLKKYDFLEVYDSPNMNMVKATTSGPVKSYMKQIIDMKEIVEKKLEIKQEGVAKLSGGKISFDKEIARKTFLKFQKDRKVKEALRVFFSDPRTCALNKSPMIDIGVYGKVDFFSEEKIEGWLIDTIVKEPWCVQMKLNGIVFKEAKPIAPTFINPLGRHEKCSFVFDFNIHEVASFLDGNEFFFESNFVTIDIVYKRINKRLKKGRHELVVMDF